MWSVCKKEIGQFFSSLGGYITIVLFLLVNGLFLFLLPDGNVFESGFASLDRFFDLARRGVSVIRDSRSTAQVKELSYPNDRFVLPIPLRELQTNENMIPNPGFN